MSAELHSIHLGHVRPVTAQLSVAADPPVRISWKGSLGYKRNAHLRHLDTENIIATTLITATMSDPCPGLRVRMYARKSGGPYAKMPQQKSTIGAHAVDYTIKATPGVNFGLIVKVKEDFDFKGSEGLCITITITDDCRVGNGAAAAPFRLEQSWYVDALSKWSGRQTFHKFDKVVTSDGSLARDLEFTVPFSIERKYQWPSSRDQI